MPIDQGITAAIGLDGDDLVQLPLTRLRLKQPANSSDLRHHQRPRFLIIVFRLRLAPAAFLLSDAERKGEDLRASPLSCL